jgi:hypothetical protein
MRIHENLITEEEIGIFRNYWETHKDEIYVNGYQENEIQDYRLDINEKDPEFDIIRKIVKTDFPQYLSEDGTPKDRVFFWSALQRAVLPHVLHIDDCFVDSRPAYTYIIAFDTYEKHKTLAWKRICQDGSKELLTVLQDWQKNLTAMPKLSKVEDIEHTPITNDEYMLDYFEFDGEFPYVKGSGCVFNARQMHCTSNWKKYGEFESRELLQIHVTIPDLIEF